MLDRPEPAGAADAALDLVGDEQGAVLLAQALDFFQVARGGQVDAFALDRLDNERGHIFAA